MRNNNVRTMHRWAATALLAVVAMAGCADDENGMGMGPEPLDPNTATRVMVDRFSDDAAMLFRRSANPGLPAAGAPVDFDVEPFKTAGLGPDGEPVRYYNFDVMPTAPAPIFVLFYEGTGQKVSGQLNIVDDIPGDSDYNDFWQVVRVTVPDDYVANTATSLDDLVEGGYPMDETTTLVNCPVVPEGSTASEGGGAEGLTQGWFRDEAVFYFNFGEAPLETTGAGAVPTSPILVSFNVNPDEDGGGPPSGFMAQGSSVQTHNVIATLPADAGYSPLWEVMPYDNTAFPDVWNLESALDAPSFGTAALVNCPVVFVGDAPGDPATASRAMVDRFSDDAGMLFRRSANAGLPGAGQPIDFDIEPFKSQGFGPEGNVVRYYNFDVQPRDPAPIWALFYENGDKVPGQKNIVAVAPGDVGYNDFWRVIKVTVPDGYITNSATSAGDLINAGYDMEETDILVNCPIVPEGSTAEERLGGEDPGLVQGWYEGEIIQYFNFSEASLSPTAEDQVPTSPIFVTFNINPDEDGGGPPSGFMTEPGTSQTHNVIATDPDDAGYSPLWEVMPYDNASFDMVTDLMSAINAPGFGTAALVNCPVVFME